MQKYDALTEQFKKFCQCEGIKVCRYSSLAKFFGGEDKMPRIAGGVT